MVRRASKKVSLWISIFSILGVCLLLGKINGQYEKKDTGSLKKTTNNQELSSVTGEKVTRQTTVENNLQGNSKDNGFPYNVEEEQSEVLVHNVASTTRGNHIYYVVAHGGYVTVYVDDLETLFLATKIRVNSLPFELQKKIENIMMINEEKELYGFLESYTS